MKYYVWTLKINHNISINLKYIKFKIYNLNVFDLHKAPEQKVVAYLR